MSESVVVTSGANAPWQVHRFSSALLKAPAGWGGVVEQLPARSSRSAEGRLFKNTAKRRAGERGVEEGGEAHQMGKEVIARWG